MPKITILIPTYNRVTALAVTLTSLTTQSFKDFAVVISDQSSDINVAEDPSIKAVTRLLKVHGNQVQIFKNLPSRGIAQQRQFLLDHSLSPYSLFLDDDVILDTWVLENLVKAIEEEQCGFVGQAVIGLSFLADHRPKEEAIEFWIDKVSPEIVKINSEKWQRHKLHNAANLYHVQNRLKINYQTPRKYKVAWIGGCVLYDTKKLKQIGGFEFWNKLPKEHVGEDVLIELKLMEKFGGCGLIPSGVYHQELPTTLPNRKYNAPELL